MLFREIVANICETRTKQIYTRHGQITEYFIVKSRTAWTRAVFWRVQQYVISTAAGIGTVPEIKQFQYNIKLYFQAEAKVLCNNAMWYTKWPKYTHATLIHVCTF